MGINFDKNSFLQISRILAKLTKICYTDVNSFEMQILIHTEN